MLKTLTNHNFKLRFEFVSRVIRFSQFYFASEIYDFKSFMQYMRFTSKKKVKQSRYTPWRRLGGEEL
jgi:hypothetical protein